MRRRLFLMGCVLILGAAVQSCRETGVNPWDKPKDGDPNTTDQLTKEQLVGTHWQFQRFETATTVSLPTEDFIDLRFEGLNRIGGKAICNVYGGEVELQNGSINVSNIISTEAYCGDDKLDQEYVQALNKAQSWTATANELRIKYVPEVSAGGSGGVLVFKRLNGGNDNGLELKLKQLESKQYTLHSFVNGGIEEVPVGAQSCL
ncbi:MAG TPA: META domain-containing protein, partial [Candidatus Kapabacteria bacterium]|nr:META domain-containing protein [Candidatus Kapabacteria bacterium]